MWFVLAVACSGGGGDSAVDSGDTSIEPVEQVVAEPTHDADIQPIWDDACRGCHTPSFDFGELVLTDAFTELSGVESVGNAPMPRVLPGDADGSYLWHKLAGSHREVGGGGDTMPAGGRPVLSDVRLQTIRNWIETGAPR